ncbi:glycoside hydrolase family 19 protein [Cupriavidus sp. 2MCAB6]|uniref:glycoside hydrolase family 19 protein n=1 Tax=Cupriavidus sp. 2MCAB6 TaxID=3232981 RepID=UPI003F8FBED5
MDQQAFQAAAGLSPALAARWWPHIEPALFEFGILSPARVAAWIAQTGHESLGFSLTRELWGPTPAQMRYERDLSAPWPPADRASRNQKPFELGNSQPGDGKRFMGRGLIQITGRANYRTCGAALGFDLQATPAMLEGDALAARSACWFWHSRGLNALADAGAFETLTRRINGGINGLADRQERWARAKQFTKG